MSSALHVMEKIILTQAEIHSLWDAQHQLISLRCLPVSNIAVLRQTWCTGINQHVSAILKRLNIQPALTSWLLGVSVNRAQVWSNLEVWPHFPSSQEGYRLDAAELSFWKYKIHTNSVAFPQDLVCKTYYNHLLRAAVISFR